MRLRCSVSRDRDWTGGVQNFDYDIDLKERVSMILLLLHHLSNLQVHSFSLTYGIASSLALSAYGERALEASKPAAKVESFSSLGFIGPACSDVRPRGFWSLIFHLRHKLAGLNLKD